MPVVPFRDGRGRPPRPPFAPTKPMCPRTAAHLLRNLGERLERLQCSLALLNDNLKVKTEVDAGLFDLAALASLCGAEVDSVYSDELIPVIRGIEANEPDAST